MGEAESAGESSFEKELENLERVVNLLERGELDLEEAIRQYESGHRSLRRCQLVLESAKRRIEILSGSLEPSGPKAQEPAASVDGRGGSPPVWGPVEFSGPSLEEPESPGDPRASS